MHISSSCGSGQGAGGFGASFVNTTNAKLGDLGSQTLPARDTGVEWTAGGVYEVAWTLQANHGGGYQYRLCPKPSAQTEECFRAHPLDFADKTTTIRYHDGRRLSPGL